MKIIFPFLIFILFATAGRSQTVTCGSPFFNLGLPVTFCGIVKGATVDSLGKKSGTILFLCGEYPHQGMTVIIKDAQPPLFTYPLDYWTGKYICATGVVQTFHGKYYIEIKKKTNLFVR